MTKAQIAAQIMADALNKLFDLNPSLHSDHITPRDLLKSYGSERHDGEKYEKAMNKKFGINAPSIMLARELIAEQM